GVLPRLGIKHGLHAALEFMPYLALFGERPQATREFLDKMIGNLLRRDKSKNSNLSRTLLTYLDLNASQVRTAESLHIHVNTVKQRLSAISNILGDDWATTDKAFRLHVALRIHFAANDSSIDALAPKKTNWSVHTIATSVRSQSILCANILLDADGSRPLGRAIYYHDVEIGVGLHSCGDTHWIDQSIGLHDVLCFLTSHVKERLEHI